VNGRPLVSVVTIFRDAEAFLDEAVASVFAQTHPDWELLLVDDGSVDGSTAYAAAWAQREPERVRYLEHPGHANRGMSAARNLGIGHSRGRYLAFLDADDVWLPEKLMHQVALLEAWPEAAMVYGPSQYWYSWTGLERDRCSDFLQSLGVPTDTLLWPPSLLIHLVRNEGASPCPSSILVRRAAVQQVGGFEEAFTDLYEDQAFCAKIWRAFAVIASSQCWYRYRQHPASACAVAEVTGRARSARLQFLTWLEAYLAREHVLTRELRAELRQQRRPLRNSLLHRAMRPARRLRKELSALRLQA
jgi:glycosyltransferase involved in cell wall biosynthesis